MVERRFEMSLAFEEDASLYPFEVDPRDAAFQEIERALDDLRAQMRLWVDVSLLPTSP